MKLETTLKVMGRIAKSFPKASKERKVLAKAAHALFFISRQETRRDFENYIKSIKQPLNGYQMLHLKICGIEIPDELKTPDVMEIEAEMDALADKIYKFRGCDPENT